jgi:long-chain fatty acid transport protein
VILNKSWLTVLSFITTNSVISVNVGAAGFQLHESSVSGLGRSFAGEGVVADDASVIARNPAAMALFEEKSLTFGFTYIEPGADIRGKQAPVAYTAPLQAAGGSFDVSELDQDGVIPATAVPIVYFINPVNEQFAFGAGLNVNYGLSSKFDSDYPAGSIGGKTVLLALNGNFSGSFRVNSNLILGVGMNVVYADALLERRAGVTGASIFGSAEQTIIKLEGDDTGWGWNAGVIYEVNEFHRFSLTYHSKVDLKFDGDLKETTPTANGPVITKSGGTLETELPEIFEISGFHQISDDWALHYSLRRTGWDSFETLEGFDENGRQVLFKEEKFVNTNRYSLGVTYTFNNQLTLRAGLAKDEAAADELRSISIPDSDRFWYSAGATYAVSRNSSIDLGLSYVDGDSVKIVEKDGVLEGRVPEGTDEWEFEGEANAFLIGLAYNYRF